MSISVADARSLYLAELNRVLAATPYALQNAKRYVLYDPSSGQSVALSLLELIREAQMGSAIGVNEAVKYAQSLGYRVQ